MTTDPPTLTEWNAAQPTRQSRRAAIYKLPPGLLDQVTTAATDPDGPSARMVYRWLTTECDIDISYGQVDYYYQRIRQGNGTTAG